MTKTALDRPAHLTHSVCQTCATGKYHVLNCLLLSDVHPACSGPASWLVVQNLHHFCPRASVAVAFVCCAALDFGQLYCVVAERECSCVLEATCSWHIFALAHGTLHEPYVYSCCWPTGCIRAAWARAHEPSGGLASWHVLQYLCLACPLALIGAHMAVVCKMMCSWHLRAPVTHVSVPHGTSHGPLALANEMCVSE